MDRSLPRLWPPAAGLFSGALGLAAGELWSSVIGGAGPVIVVGNRVVDGVPRGVKTWAIDTFGTNDKVALVTGVLVITAVFSALVGIRAAKKFANGAVGIGIFALVGVFAATTGRDPSAKDFGPLVFAFVVALVALWFLIARPQQRAVPSADGKSNALVNRRQFLVLGGGAAAATAVTAVGARALTGPDPVKQSAQPIPKTVMKLPSTPAGAQIDVPNMTPFLTPNDRYYRIDTALVVPRLNANTWKMKVGGLVKQELEVTYADLRDGRFGDLVEHDCTLMCVSNEVGGGLIGNARWTGIPLRKVLEVAGVQERAEQIFARSTDGFTAGFPTKLAFDGREALIAIGMNGEPLPAKHGYPARLVVPGIYGYVSAVKWLERITLTTFADDEGYWIPRGWATLAPIKTSSRIDVIGSNGRIGPAPAGATPIAGVAWAQHTGIAKVEVQIDDGQWVEATLAADGGLDTWRQWKYVWDAKSGDHKVAVRATDKTGFTQRAERVDVAPDGAEGYHTVLVSINKA